MVKQFIKINLSVIFMFLIGFVTGQITEVTSGLNNANDFDIAGNKAYISNDETNAPKGSFISELDLNVSSPTANVIFKDLNRILGINNINGKIFFTETLVNNKIIKFSPNESNPSLVTAISNLELPVFILDGNSTDLFFVDLREISSNNFKYRLLKLNYSENSPSVSTIIEDIGFFSNEILYFNNKIFLTNFNYSKIYQVDLSETNPSVKEFLQLSEQPFNLATYGNYLYWSAPSSRTIKKANLTQSNPSIELAVSFGSDQGVDAPLIGPIKFDEQGNLYVLDTFFGKLYKVDSSTISVKDIALEREIKVYPNPAKNFIRIENNLNENKGYRIFNSMGDLIKSGKLDKDNLINIEYLNQGVYFIYMGEKSYKFIKK